MFHPIILSDDELHLIPPLVVGDEIRVFGDEDAPGFWKVELVSSVFETKVLSNHEIHLIAKTNILTEEIILMHIPFDITKKILVTENP